MAVLPRAVVVGVLMDAPEPPERRGDAPVVPEFPEQGDAAGGHDQSAVDQAADQMLAAVNEAEVEFGNPLIPAIDAVRLAMAMSTDANRPVVICDPQDNPGAGAVGDSTGLLAALAAEGAADACIGVIWDPDTAAQAHAAGEGATIEAAIGGRFPEVGGPPVRAKATVERLSDGQFLFTGPMYGGATANLGPMACLRVRENGADLRVVVGSARAQNADQEMFRAVGIEPARQRIVVRAELAFSPLSLP